MSKRGEWALRRLTLHYCRRGGSSKGVRDFIERGVAEFARRNPQIEVRTVVRNGRHPYLQGLYPGNHAAFESAGAGYQPRVPPHGPDRTVELGVKNMDADQVEEQCEVLRARSGHKSKPKLKKWWFSKHPSIQGMWRPGMFQEGSKSSG